ncbi:MAG: winged helix-turn-helix domain-containing protein, partial [Pseudomonadota bacterium]
MTDQHRSGPFHFADARFDPASGRLTRDGRTVQLRPTTARLLGAILSAAEAHPAGVQTKDALIASVWPRGQASEQSLFQAISELRRALAPLEAVTTVPNQGYRFDLTVTRANARSWPRLSMVASVVLMAVVVLVGQGGPATGAPHDAAISPS